MSNEPRKPLTSITAIQAKELLEAYVKEERHCTAKELLEVITGTRLDCTNPPILCENCTPWLQKELERLISEGYITKEALR